MAKLICAEDWLDEDQLMLLECWSRDGYTLSDIALKIGISGKVLSEWRVKYPEINDALKRGREIIDYKVENALLKSALGYRAKEVKVTTTIRNGHVVETVKETTHRDQAPNVSAIQCWLYNRLPEKWKKNRDSILDVNDEDTTIQVTVTRASKDELESDGDEVNESISIRSKTKDEIEAESQSAPKVEEHDLDYWPDDWDDE